MRSNIYILFGFLAGIAVVCIAVFTVIVATSHAVSPSDFPRYAYSDYIDRTSSMTFNVAASEEGTNIDLELDEESWIEQLEWFAQIW